MSPAFLSVAMGICVLMDLPTEDIVNVAELSATVMLTDFSSHFPIKVFSEFCSLVDNDAINSLSTLYVTLLPPLISKESESAKEDTGVSWSIVLEFVWSDDSTADTTLVISSCVSAILVRFYDLYYL
jgi:hypothetical protein